MTTTSVPSVTLPVTPQASDICLAYCDYEFAYVDAHIDPEKKWVILRDRQSNQRFVTLAFLCYIKLCKAYNRLRKAEVNLDGEDGVLLVERFHRYGDRFYYLTLQRYRNKIYLYLKLYVAEADVRKSDITPLSTLRFDIESDRLDIILPKIFQISQDLYNPEDSELPPPLPFGEIEQLFQPPPPPTPRPETPNKTGAAQLQRTMSFQLAAPTPRGGTLEK